MSSRELADLRREYARQPLNAEDVQGQEPIAVLARWVDDAVRAEVKDATAMTLATVDAEGGPDARIVLLKGIEGGQLFFYSNYDSAKGEQLAARPRAALVFYWAELERQIRVWGPVAKASREASKAYFQTRPRGSQLGAWVSAQSEVIESREVLETRLEALERAYPEGAEIPLPDHWGGYSVTPERIEMWQGRRSRLHDRLCARQQDGVWRWERLSP